MGKILIVLILIFVFFNPGWAAPVEEEYKLKQLCENDAQELFKKETGKMKLNKINLSYTSHYNKSLKTCFMMIQLSTDLNLLEPPAIENLSYDFYDVNENEKIGAFLMEVDRNSGKQSLIYCRVSKEECHSLPEWKKLVKPFMQE